jgi:hypothetical protein
MIPITADLEGPAREITVEPLEVPEPVEVPQEAPAEPVPA